MHTVTAKHENLDLSPKYKRQSFWRQEAQNLEQEKHTTACDTRSCMASNCQVKTFFTSTVDQHHKLPVVCTHQSAVPNIQRAGRTHSIWRIYSVPLHISSVYRTWVPIWNCSSLYADRAAKCKMEMAQESITSAVPSERLRSQNTPARHTVHASSHPLLSTISRILRCEGGHYRTS